MRKMLLAASLIAMFAIPAMAETVLDEDQLDTITAGTTVNFVGNVLDLPSGWTATDLGNGRIRISTDGFNFTGPGYIITP